MTPATAEAASRLRAAQLQTPLLFVLAGGLAAVANFLSRILLSMFMPYAGAIVGAFLAGMLTAFLLNRRFVFPGATQGLIQQAFWFVTINLLALLQTLAISLFLADNLLPRLGVSSHVDTIAHAIGIIVPVFTSYLQHRRLTFR